MINVLERITNLRKQKRWTEYELAERSGLTQSTISSWYRKDILPSIPSLEKICAAFDITLSQFFADESDTFSLTPRQKELLEQASHLTQAELEALIGFFKAFEKN